jgi:two-component system OmpR family response regulator
MKALLVDDEDDIRLIASMSLTLVGGMEVLEAASGVAGLRLAQEEQPDVILLDVMMPVFDGPSTLAALRASAATAAVPVIFLTAKAMPAEVERLKQLGAVGVLTKPFDPMQLPGHVMRTLEAAERGCERLAS